MLNLRKSKLRHLIPESLVYCANFIRYFFYYKNSDIAPNTYIIDSTIGKGARIGGGYMIIKSSIGTSTDISGTRQGIDSYIVRTHIGKYCSIGINFHSYGVNHIVKAVSTYSFKTQEQGSEQDDVVTEPVHIGNDVCVGANVTILGGVTVGDGAVIGAGAVVTKNVRPYEVVGGVPARHIRFRFSDSVISHLLEISWWDWETYKIKKFQPDLLSTEVHNFIAKHATKIA